VRFHTSVLGICSVLSSAGALLLLEYSLTHDEQSNFSPPATPNGLISKPSPRSAEDVAEEALTSMRDMAAAVALVCLITSLSFESFKRYEWVYRPQSGPIDSKTADLKLVKVLYNQWNSTEDLIGIILGAAKALLLTATVSTQFLNLFWVRLQVETWHSIVS
jgi:hypothetical protein